MHTYKGILGSSRDTGKENGNYHLGSGFVYIALQEDTTGYTTVYKFYVMYRGVLSYVPNVTLNPKP